MAKAADPLLLRRCFKTLEFKTRARIAVFPMTSSLDLIIIGAGVAGLTASIHAGQQGLKCMTVAEMGVGGQIMNAPLIENFPGYPQGIAGVELGPMLHEQAEDAGAEFCFDTIKTIEIQDDGFVARGIEETLFAKSVIIAAGSRLKTLGVDGEARLTGRGVSHCASCDGPLYRGKRLFVVGGGDAAFDEALALAEFAAHVEILCRSARPRAQKKLQARVAAAGNIGVRFNTSVQEILGADYVTGLRLRGAEGVEPADGVFIYAGLQPNTEFLNGLLALDDAGRIIVDAKMQSSVAGIFVAGDIRSQSLALLPDVASDGETAAAAAAEYCAGRAG